jgi:uncharacterized membrane protein (TIGR02234 family)
MPAVGGSHQGTRTIDLMSTVTEHTLNSRRRTRREFTVTLAAGLMVSGATALGMSQSWVTATATPQRLPRVVAEVTGGGLAPLAGALAFVPLAALGAVLASRGWLRRAVGLVMTGCAIVIAVAAVRPGGSVTLLEQGLAAKGWTAASPYTTTTTAWRWIVLVAGIGCAFVGALTVLRGPNWPTMGQRYDALDAGPTAHAERGACSPGDELDEETLWRELDRGHDPTGEP